MYSVDAVDAMHCHQTVLRLVIVLLNVIMVQSPRRSIVSKASMRLVVCLLNFGHYATCQMQ